MTNPPPQGLAHYDRSRTYQWNYDNPPAPIPMAVPEYPGRFEFCGLPVDSPLGMPAGPLLNGLWILYYASLGFDVLTYKTVRSVDRACYPLPNLQPVTSGQLNGDESELAASDQTKASWAVSFGMPSVQPELWRRDIETTRDQLPSGKLLSVSVVGTVQPEWTIDNLADDYAACARWAVDSGADCVETNFSCPNVSTCDGQLFQQIEDAGIVVEKVRHAVGSIPFIVKIGHVTERGAASNLLNRLGPHVDALALTNSVATVVRGTDGRLMFDGQQRGICGDATRTASIAQTRLFSELIHEKRLNVKLIGVGGASTAEHVMQYLNAGAAAVHIATAAMLDPSVGIQIRTTIAETENDRVESRPL